MKLEAFQEVITYIATCLHHQDGSSVHLVIQAIICPGGIGPQHGDEYKPIYCVPSFGHSNQLTSILTIRIAYNNICRSYNIHCVEGCISIYHCDQVLSSYMAMYE